MSNFSVYHVIGAIGSLCLQTSNYSKVPIEFLYLRWKSSLLKNQFLYIESNAGDPAGFIIWKICSHNDILKEIKGSAFQFEIKLDAGEYIYILDLICHKISPMFFARQIREVYRRNLNIKGVVYSKNINGVYKSFLRSRSF